jgi:enamine deaminase RidA (YjgF/YER057c/UK114 family)
VWYTPKPVVQFIVQAVDDILKQEYGVTFERAVAIQYGDRKHVFISGTASINNKGQIVHPMDVIKQAGRMFENILTLLHEAEATAEDIAQMIVYIRDIADYQTINNHINKSYPQIPAVIVLASVCRPGWLIEAECMAITATNDSRFADF